VEANEISQELGTTTVKVKSHSKPRFGLSSGKGQRQGSVSFSEQKRPLLLPQEVKELGRDRELLLFEGLRPVLAHKNRYFEDSRLKKRLFPPPKRAAPQRRTGDAFPDETVTAMNSREESSPPDGLSAALAVKTRAATAHDIEHIDELTLEDFAIDTSQILIPEKPDGERFTEAELDKAVHTFLDALKER
jgi:type IV secretion system protein VirD4